jgi:hypothetical protein
VIVIVEFLQYNPDKFPGTFFKNFCLCNITCRQRGVLLRPDEIRALDIIDYKRAEK